MAISRLVDTRDGTGGLTGPPAAGGEYRVKVAGAGGIPATNVSAVALVLRLLDTRLNGGALAAGATRAISQGSIVATAPTLVLNATVADPTGDGYIVAYPHVPMPSPHSNVNYITYQTTGNLVLGATGGSTVDFTNISGDASAQLIVDLNGYLSRY